MAFPTRRERSAASDLALLAAERQLLRAALLLRRLSGNPVFAAVVDGDLPGLLHHHPVAVRGRSRSACHSATRWRTAGTSPSWLLTRSPPPWGAGAGAFDPSPRPRPRAVQSASTCRLERRVEHVAHLRPCRRTTTWPMSAQVGMAESAFCRRRRRRTGILQRRARPPLAHAVLPGQLSDGGHQDRSRGVGLLRPLRCGVAGCTGAFSSGLKASVASPVPNWPWLPGSASGHAGLGVVSSGMSPCRPAHGRHEDAPAVRGLPLAGHDQTAW